MAGSDVLDQLKKAMRSLFKRNKTSSNQPRAPQRSSTGGSNGAARTSRPARPADAGPHNHTGARGASNAAAAPTKTQTGGQHLNPSNGDQDSPVSPISDPSLPTDNKRSSLNAPEPAPVVEGGQDISIQEPGSQQQPRYQVHNAATAPIRSSAAAQDTDKIFFEPPPSDTQPAAKQTSRPSAAKPRQSQGTSNTLHPAQQQEEGARYELAGHDEKIPVLADQHEHVPASKPPTLPTMQATSGPLQDWYGGH